MASLDPRGVALRWQGEWQAPRAYAVGDVVWVPYSCLWLATGPTKLGVRPGPDADGWFPFTTLEPDGIPLPDGTGATGVSGNAARADHVHPA